jgi:putative restriction endonuclease
MAADYLFTWTPKNWPYAKLRNLIDDFESGGEVSEPWRCSAHTMVRPGDTAYFVKLGRPQGIFGVGTITEPAFKNATALPKQNPWQVPITFRQLVDPTRTLLVSEVQLAAMPVPAHTWHPRASGVRLAQEAARSIDEIIGGDTDDSLSADAADLDAFDIKNIKDARERINRSIAVRRGQRAFRTRLLAAYGGKCAVTGCGVEDLLEAAHIEPYRGPTTNHVQNGLLLRSDIHTLFDCRLIAIDPSSMRLILSPRLVRGGYKLLAGKKVRLPKKANETPSSEALGKHRRQSGL